MIQKILMVIPCLKLADSFSYYLFINQCPWATEKDEFAAKYLIMALVTLSSVYQAIAVGIFMTLSWGWVLLNTQIDREVATSVTVTMGITYLCHSAYYVSLPNSAFRGFMEWFMVFLYCYIFYFCMKYLIRCLAITDKLLSYLNRNRVWSLLPATELKSSMLRQYLVIMTLFFCEWVIFQGLIPAILEYFSLTLYLTTLIDMIQHFADCIILGWLLITFRSRVWPDYFFIASLELGNLQPEAAM